MRTIETTAAPIPRGHYSQAVVANGFVFVAGQLPYAPGPDRVMPDGIEAQAEQVFKNIACILTESKSGLEHLVSVQIFLPNISLWDQVNVVYTRLLGAHKPARTVIPCGPLHYGALIEVNAVAVTS